MLVILCKVYLWFISPLFCLVCTGLSFFIPTLKQRIEFEQKNFSDAQKGFKHNGHKAAAAFEVSSEGELEQAMPLILHALAQSLNIELIYCSDSVENKVQRLANQWSNLRVLRLPLVTYLPFINGRNVKSWMTANKLILCRYDFFPELLVLGAAKKREFILISATLQNKKLNNIFFKFMWASIYNLFDQIVVTNQADKIQMGELATGTSLCVADFRVLQILDRLKKMKENHFFQSEIYKPFFNLLESNYPQGKIIFGSFWEAEVKLLTHPQLQKDILNGDLLVVIAPHKLDSSSLERLDERLKSTLPEIPRYILADTQQQEQVSKLASSMKTRPGMIISTVKGVLCELYSFFQFSYVGGGFGKSVHSVLEPYLAGNRVFCGPKVQRSTEFVQIVDRDPTEIVLIDHMEEFYQIYLKSAQEQIDLALRSQLVTGIGPILNSLFPSPNKGATHDAQ